MNNQRERKCKNEFDLNGNFNEFILNQIKMSLELWVTLCLVTTLKGKFIVNIKTNSQGSLTTLLDKIVLDKAPKV